MTASSVPDAAMMAPVRAIASFMATLDEARLAQVFADDVVIVENFAPYVFRGPDAALHWRVGFCGHAQGLSGLAVAFGPAQDFSRSGDTVYFVLPTVWTGTTNQKPFEEEGGWAFVLRRDGAGWRIASYAWAVTAFRLI
jgi:ketosteroid isomerase-like protein